MHMVQFYPALRYNWIILLNQQSPGMPKIGCFLWFVFVNNYNASLFVTFVALAQQKTEWIDPDISKKKQWSNCAITYQQ